MKITLVQKNDPSDKQPLLVQIVKGEEDEFQEKETCSISVGQTLDLPDDIAIEIMQKYKGCFKIGDGVNLSEKAMAYANKSAKAFTKKILESQAPERRENASVLSNSIVSKPAAQATAGEVKKEEPKA